MAMTEQRLAANRKKASERMKKELAAQKARAEALAYLKETGAGDGGGSTTSVKKDGSATRNAFDVRMDNTIKSVRERRARDLKQKLLNHQERLRKSIEKAKKRIANKDGWQHVKDAKTGKYYWWNKNTDETSWTRPLDNLGLSAEAQEKYKMEPKRIISKLWIPIKAPPPAPDTNAKDEDSTSPPAPDTNTKDEASTSATNTVRVYYWNTYTNKATWDRPEGVPKPKIKVPPRAPTADELNQQRQQQAKKKREERENRRKQREQRDAARLFVGGLAYRSTEPRLKKIFQRYGKVIDCKIVMQKDDPTKSRGFGFVGFEKVEDAKAAEMGLDGTVFDGRPIKVNFANNKPGTDTKRKRMSHGRVDAFGEKKARHLELQDRFLARPGLARRRAEEDEVDPMMPGGKQGRWADGLNIDGERAADTTASGPLFQQRPYPAPGSILKRQHQRKADEGAAEAPANFSVGPQVPPPPPPRNEQPPPPPPR